MPLDVLLRAVWVLRWRVVLAILLLLAGGAAAILLWPRQYVAEAIVAPSETTGLSTSTFIQTGLSMPAPLLDTRATGNFAIYLALLRSPEAADQLVRETPLLDYLTERRRNGLVGTIRTALGVPPTADLDDARLWLERNLSITQSLQTVTTTLAVTHRDRDAALDVLRRVHAFAEGQVRASLAELWRRRIAALEGQLSAERDVFVRTPIFEILAQHQRAAVVTSADEAVAARLVSPPVVGIWPEVPNRPLLLALLAAAAPAVSLLGAACLVLVFGAPEPRLRSPGRGREPVLAVARARED